MFNLIARMWRKRQRSIDMVILWPSCKSLAVDLDHAKAAFAIHAFNDSAWTNDLSERQIIDLIDALPGKSDDYDR